MTRDAKIGLLLGLAFIFVIAFIVNGLPNFRGDKDSNELTAGMVSMPYNSPGIGAREREVINRTPSINNPLPGFQNPPIGDPDIRFKTPLPQYQGPLIVKDDTASSLQKSDTVKTVDISLVEDKKTEVKNPQTFEPALPKTYVVENGDNLSTIALKFYGPEEGNKRAVIAALFKANSKLLLAPDEIQVGQELIVPSLSEIRGEKEKSTGGLAGAIFEKVKSIGREHLSLKKPDQAKQGKSYTVLDGDSLWRIASEELGDGSRYKEIVRLNKDTLGDEDSLTVGMTLKIPPK